MFSTAADNQPAVSIHVLQGEREMAAHNRTLGRFELTGIPPAPRGVPQIEVTFDIDANGIVHVSAKDMGTGKEQKIRIESSSGLSEEEINRMVQEAEANAEADKSARDMAEARNNADSLVYQSEKALKDFGDKVSAEEKAAVEAAVADLKTALEGSDVEAVKQKTEALTQASQKLSEEMYKAQAGEAGAGAADGGPEAAPGDASEGEASSGPQSDDVEDADYEVVDEDK